MAVQLTPSGSSALATSASDGKMSLTSTKSPLTSPGSNRTWPVDDQRHSRAPIGERSLAAGNLAVPQLRDNLFVDVFIALGVDRLFAPRFRYP